MKYFKAILVVSLIFIFPTVSYLYLRSGFTYRKEALEELKNEVDLSKDQKDFLLAQDSSFFDDETKLVHLYLEVKDANDESDLYFLAENLKQRADFSLVGMYVNTELPSFRDTIYSTTLSRFQIDQDSFFDGNQRLILSKDHKVRKTYAAGVEEFKKAYEHAVILLPMKKRDKVTLKRENEK